MPRRAAIVQTAMTIAGFDPSSGAGVSADLLVFAAHGIFATSAVTALTVQSTAGVRSVHPVAAEVLANTLACLEDDLPPDAVKIGMLADDSQVRAVAAYLRAARSRRALTVVLDPVLRSSSGAILLTEEGLRTLQEHLLPLVDVITPNLSEAALLSRLPCTTTAEMEKCALALRERYPRLQLVVTGGHLEPPDDLWSGDDGVRWFEGARVATNATHGTGCAFSSALLSGWLGSASWPEAVDSAKRYVLNAMLTATPRGHGRGPLNLFASPESRTGAGSRKHSPRR